MNMHEDEKWQSLLLRSTPTFAGEAAPPYGFITGTLAQLRSEKRQQEERPVNAKFNSENATCRNGPASHEKPTLTCPAGILST